jgi:tryptophan synthase alpha chain
MNRINELFEKKKNNILSVYFSAGFPNLSDTVEIIKSLENNGADMVEIGIPFSDPIADGPVIQKSNDIALKNGMNLKLLFEQLSDIRKEVSIPLIMMGYLNPALKYGLGNFCRMCAKTGIDGVILPDLPFELYLEQYQNDFKENGLHNIFLIPPQTSDERIQRIDQESEGFLYIVSASSVTGAKKEIQQNQIAYFERIKNLHLNNQTLIGFGISNNETFIRACQYANGAIIGSAFIKALENSGNIEESIHDFVQRILMK